MHIALFFWDRLPVPDYGGTQRMVVSLARGLAAAGHRVTLVAGHGSVVPEATLVPVSIAEARRPEFDIRPLLPPSLDIVLACAPLRTPPEVPWIRRLAGNWKPGTTGAPNTLYLSRNHAERHGGRAFVYNGVDPAEYRFRDHKDDYDLFLGRLHGVKGYRWAASGAKRLRRRMVIAGGWRPSLSRYVRYVGRVGGSPEDGAAGGGEDVLDARALGRAVRYHADRSDGERHAGAGHRPRLPAGDHLTGRRRAGGHVWRSWWSGARRWMRSRRRRAGPGWSGTSPITRWPRGMCGCFGTTSPRGRCRRGR